MHWSFGIQFKKLKFSCPHLRVQLSLSLGFKAIWSEDNHKDSLPLYKVEITGTPEDKLKLFKLKRKHNFYLILLKFQNYTLIHIE